mmetsp:Transcript_36686/g.53633  ORF Transcript_36686/g.53633 Transcript_36686/m.53633 type:complete len:81 (+) Transcript_36686:456-698(+)
MLKLAAQVVRSVPPNQQRVTIGRDMNHSYCVVYRFHWAAMREKERRKFEMIQSIKDSLSKTRKFLLKIIPPKPSMQKWME